MKNISNKFNYIIPIFNKEDILPLTLEGVDKCASQESKIFTIIDGCTDRSENVVDEFIARTGRDVEKIHMPNVHMLRSVNAALKRVTEGFSIVMQDDIILEDVFIEKKIFKLYQSMGDRLGVISFRAAANLRLTPLRRRITMGTLRPMIEEVDLIHSPDDHNLSRQSIHEKFYPRIGAINGPNCIPWAVLKKIGIFDETLAPYGFDDPEYGLRAMKAGFVNGLYPIKYKSDINWGGTRRSKAFIREAQAIHRRNRIYIWNKHREFIKILLKSKLLNSSADPVESLEKIPNYSTIEDN